MAKVYITTAIPYVNGRPHIGHAMDYLLADVMARYQTELGNQVRLQAGTDEHGNKIWQKAKELGKPVDLYVTENSRIFREFIGMLGVETTDFVRTTDKEHERRVQEIWKKLKPYIYLNKYEGWYCTGCERFVTEKECKENEGVCPDHQKPYERLEEENYYLRISDFKERIREAILAHEMEILPKWREKEVLKLLEDSPDVSVSRPRTQLTWGVPVPDDETQVMYVWMDALANYITVLGYPEQSIDDWWPAMAQFVGKDILRFHAIIWPAMLMGLGLPLPKTLVSHGMVTTNGQKMSKSLGNVVDPMEVIEKHGVEAFRYYFLRHVDTFADADFTWEKYEEAYNNELANDLGNLVQRLATMLMKNGIESASVKSGLAMEYRELMDKFEFAKAFDYVWGRVQAINKRIDDEKPWALAKNGEEEKLRECLLGLTADLLEVAQMLKPFLPETAKKIQTVFAGSVQPPEKPLFPKN